MRATVIGAGVVGCAVGLELRRRGHEVTVVDRHGEVGHGTTSASCGIVRRFYSQPGMIAMAHASTAIWADWASFLGPIDDDTAVFHRPGMLFIPPRVDDGVRGTLAEMRKLGIDVVLLSADELSERFPFLETASQVPPKPVDDPDFFEETGRPVAGAVFEKDAGYVVSPGLATRNLRSAGERDGVRFLLNHEVIEIRKLDDGLWLATNAGASIVYDNLSQCYWQEGRYEEGLQAARRLLADLPDYYFGYVFVAMNAVALGRLDEARDAIAEGRRAKPDLSLEVVQGMYGVERPEIDARRNDLLRQAGLE